jgi:hypothetical protein
MVMIRRRKLYISFKVATGMVAGNVNPENIIKYDKTMEQNNILRANGYDVIEMWECEWNKIKETLPTKKNLNMMLVSKI